MKLRIAKKILKKQGDLKYGKGQIQDAAARVAKYERNKPE